MARPITGKPRKKNLVLTVDAQTRINLDFISQIRQESISAAVAEWAAKEAKRLAKEVGKEVPNAGQMTIFEVEDNPKSE